MTSDAAQANGEVSPQGADPQANQEMMQKVAELRAHVRENFGKIALAMMSLPRYQDQSLRDMQHLILDPLVRDRIAIAYPQGAEGAPATGDVAGIAIWAKVSNSVDEKIRAQVKARVWPVRLQPEDWASGDTVWLLDVIAPDPKVTGQVIANLKHVVGESDLRMHPHVGRLIGPEMLEKLGLKKGD